MEVLLLSVFLQRTENNCSKAINETFAFVKKVDNRERQILYDFIYIWNLKKNECNKIETVIVTENTQVVTRRGRQLGRKEMGEGN